MGHVMRKSVPQILLQCCIKTCHKKKFLKLSKRDGLTGSPQGIVYDGVVTGIYLIAFNYNDIQS